MNPGNYSVWLYNGGYEFLAGMFLPVNLTNMLINFFKDKQQTSGRWLLFVELYPLRKTKMWNWIWKWYFNKMTKVYGWNFLDGLAVIYFKNENHPIRQLTRELTHEHYKKLIEL